VNPIQSQFKRGYLKKGTEIYGEKEPAIYVYQVKIGAVRSYKLLSDGHRQIGAFHGGGCSADRSTRGAGRRDRRHVCRYGAPLLKGSEQVPAHSLGDEDTGIRLGGTAGACVWDEATLKSLGFLLFSWRCEICGICGLHERHF
jgi:hypothetical protein